MTENIDFDDFLFGGNDDNTENTTDNKQVVAKPNNGINTQQTQNTQTQRLNKAKTVKSQTQPNNNSNQQTQTAPSHKPETTEQTNKQKNSDELKPKKSQPTQPIKKQNNTNINNDLEAELLANLQDIDNTNTVTQSQPKKEETQQQKTQEINNNLEDDLEAQILQDLENIPTLVEDEPKKFTMAEIVEMNKTEEEKQKEKEEEERKKREQEEAERKRKEEEEEDEPQDEKSILERKRQAILSKAVVKDESTEKVENIVGDVKKIEELDLESVDYKAFDRVNEEHIDLYYLLNDTKDNPEFLDEDLLAQSKKEDEARELKKQERQEMDFELEELVDEHSIKVDLTDILKDIESNKQANN